MPIDTGAAATLSDIGGSIPSQAESRGRAYKLADLMDTEQLDRLAATKEKRAQADSEAVREILKGEDISTPQGATKAATALQKGGYVDQAMGLLRTSQAQQAAGLETQLKQYQVADAQMDVLSQAIDPIVAQLDQMQAAGAPKAMLDAKAQQLGMAAIQQLAQAHPELRQHIAEFVQQPGALTYDGIKSADQQTKHGSQAIKDRIAQMQANTAAAKETETERANKVREGQGQQKIDNSKEALAAKGYTSQQSELLAALADRNVNLPAGLRSQQQIKATIDGLYEAHPELDAGGIADGIKSGKLKLAAETKGAQTAGTQIGKVALASNELDSFGDQTLEASNAVPRGKFVPYNQLKQLADAKISDPALLRFKAKMQALENAYNQLAARSGTDVDKRAHIHELFNSANSPQAVQTLVQALKEEAAGAKQAADKTIAETSATSIPGTGGGGAPTAQPPRPAPSAGSVKPYDDPDKEARYQAWKKQHGGG